MDCDVVVVGAGPVGLAAALSFSRSGQRVVLLDTNTRASQTRIASINSLPIWADRAQWDNRVYALTPQSQKFLESVGIWSLLHRQRIAPIFDIDVAQTNTLASVQFHSARSHIDRLATVVEHGHLLAACLAAIQYSSVQVLAAQIRSMTVDQQSALLTLDSGANVRARLIVAADGSHSKCREIAGIEASLKQYQQTAIVANLHSELPHNGLARQWFTPEGVVALLPMPQVNLVNLVWSAPDDLAANSNASHSAELLLKIIQPLALPTLGALRLIDDVQSVPLQQILAKQLIGPRFVLIGDAAHAIHPMAGHGLNLGFGDIEVLVNLLSGRPRGGDIGARQLLRRYERARSEPIAQMASVTDGLHRLFFQDSNHVFSSTVRDLGWRLVSRSSWLRKQMIDHASKN